MEVEKKLIIKRSLKIIIWGKLVVISGFVFFFVNLVYGLIVLCFILLYMLMLDCFWFLEYIIKVVFCCYCVVLLIYICKIMVLNINGRFFWVVLV